jgi:hypothetical protein
VWMRATPPVRSARPQAALEHIPLPPVALNGIIRLATEVC